ncbi:hypothetical protein HZI73_22405 [Vallitalea pronyensis]|uniref:Uncharacterized protein n=1 Tax=Vallitalea pronyensis TaxID=1348613 RepID=A0A8J8SIU7_9FIRM|nr:hypothetical protein [Vallitalea pronyensis]QUI24883.1 hypothetical protein HZI73_22405 [Vallitalea pronyensis]
MSNKEVLEKQIDTLQRLQEKCVDRNDCIGALELSKVIVNIVTYLTNHPLAGK